MKTRLGALILAGAALVAAQVRFDYKVRNDFFAGFAGDAASLAKAMEVCDDILATDPKNAEALVWHGGGLLFEAGLAFQKADQQKGMELWQRALKEMDTAVSLAPDNLGVRIPRGATVLTASHFVGSPEMTRPLIERGLSDFEKAYQVQAATFDTLGTHPKGELMIGLADGYSRMGNAEKAQAWFERIQKEMPGTPYAKSAQTWLETKNLPAREAGCLGCHTK